MRYIQKNDVISFVSWWKGKRKEKRKKREEKRKKRREREITHFVAESRSSFVFICLFVCPLKIVSLNNAKIFGKEKS